MPPEEKEAVVLSAPPPPVETDEFAAVFAELNAPAPVEKPVVVEPVAPVAPAAPATPAAPAAPAAPVVPVDPAAPVTPVVTDPAAPIVPVDPAAFEPAVPAGYVSAADFAALKAQIEEMKRTPPAAAPTPTPTPTPAPEAAPIYTTDETAAIKKYQEDWSDVAAGEALVRRQEYHGLINYIFGQLNPLLTPLLATTDSLASRTQLQELEGLIPDYHQVREPVIAWVDKQPEYLKEAFTKVTSTGTPAQIADLVERFKKDTNWATAAAPAGTVPPVVTPPAAKPAAALPAAAAAAAAALKPVKTSRTEAAGTVDPNDFDAAFKEAIAAP